MKTAQQAAAKIIRVGTRASALALAQTKATVRIWEARAKSAYHFQIIPIASEGDRNRRVDAWASPSSVGLFTKVLEDALISGRIDVAVHSLKDLPVDIAKRLVIAYFSKREDARDSLISADGLSLKRLPPKSVIGTASVRRVNFVRGERPDLTIKPLRGNLTTRIRQTLQSRDYDAIIVAAAGLKRLGLAAKAAERFDPARLVPAAGQGIIAAECRRSDRSLRRFLAATGSESAAREASAERSCLKALGAGCRLPVGIHARAIGARIRLECVVYGTAGRIGEARLSTTVHPVFAGKTVARTILTQFPAVADFLRRCR